MQTLLQGSTIEAPGESATLLDEIISQLFSNPDIPIVGFGILQDLGKLTSSFPFVKGFSTLNSVVDLIDTSSAVFPKSTRMTQQESLASLQKMVGVLLRKRLDKSQQTSHWQSRPLTSEQLNYAALDAAILPVLLQKLLQNKSSIAGLYNGQFFKVHRQLQSSLRFTPIPPDRQESFSSYEVPMGAVKNYLEKPIVRQRWPTGSEIPPPPRTMDEGEKHQTAETRRKKIKSNGSKSLKLTKAERKAARIVLKDIPGNLANLPMPGIHLGYTKDSCVDRVVGHNFLNTLPAKAFLSFQRRGGVVQTSNAFLIFCNFNGGPTYGRYENEFSEGGRYLKFSITPIRGGPRGLDELDLYEYVSESFASRDMKILLFARPSSKSKFIYCGECDILLSADNLSAASVGTVDLRVVLKDFDQLISSEKGGSTAFEDMVRSREAAYRSLR